LEPEAQEPISFNRPEQAGPHTYRYRGLTRYAVTEAPVEAEAMGEAEVLGRTPEGQVETRGAVEVEAVALERPAAAERTGRAAGSEEFLAVELEGRDLAPLVGPARLPEVAAVAEPREATAAREARDRSN